MSRLINPDDYDALDELVRAPNIRNMPGRGRNNTKKVRPKPAIQPLPAVDAEIIASAAEDEFNFTYKASRHERVWIVDALSRFYDSEELENEKWIDDVLRLIKGGKEAHVYQCLANESVNDLLQEDWERPYLAAKIYRPRKFRNLRNDHLYREGRQNLDEDGRVVHEDGMLHAMEKKTEYGLELLHTSWVAYEYTTLQMLHAAGADVPRPLVSSNNTILMEYLGDDDVPAPTMNSVHLNRREAPRLFERVIHNLDLMLAHNRIHADLSAYNILYWDGEITLIDFPQAIDPHQNRNAYAIFDRDVVRICEYFARQGVKSEPKKLAADLWKRYHRHRIPDIHPALLDPENDTDRRFWQDWSAGEG